MKPVNGVNQASVVDLGAYSRDQEHGKSGEDITYINYINQDKARPYKPKIPKKRNSQNLLLSPVSCM